MNLVGIIFALLIAPQAAASVIAVIDRQAVFDKVQEAQKIKKELEAAEQKIMKEIEDTKSSFQSEIEKFQQTEAKLSTEARQKEQTRLTQKMAMLEQQLATKRNDHLNNSKKIMDGINTKITHISESIAKKRNPPITTVLDKQLVVYTTDLDITEQATIEYDKSFPVVEPKKPSAKAK